MILCRIISRVGVEPVTKANRIEQSWDFLKKAYYIAHALNLRLENIELGDTGTDKVDYYNDISDM